MEPQNKLEINHVAKRLPYGLKVKTIDGIFDVCGWSDEIGVLLDTTLYGANAIPEYKLILMPLSSLTETIQIKGESFIAIHKILEEYCFKLGKMDEKEIRTYAVSMIEIDMPYKVAEMLLEWNFDLPHENLIEKGIAISVFDLTENPYA